MKEHELYRSFKDDGWPTGNANAMAKTLSRYMRREDVSLMQNPADIDVNKLGYMTVRLSNGIQRLDLPKRGPGATFPFD